VTLGDFREPSAPTCHSNLKDNQIHSSSSSIANHETIAMTEIELLTLALTVQGSGLRLRDQHESVGVVRFLNQLGFDGGLTHDVLGSVGPHGWDRETVPEMVALKVLRETSHDLPHHILVKGFEVIGNRIVHRDIHIEASVLQILVQVELVLV